MSDDDQRSDRDLDELVDAADAEAADDLENGRVQPAFEAIVARAHRIDPRVVGVDAVDTSAKAGRAVAHEPGPAADPRLDAVLGTLVQAARDEAEDDTREHVDGGLPPFAPRRAGAPVRWAAAAGAAVLLAAGVVLVVGLRPSLPSEQRAAEAKSQAGAVVRPEQDPGVAEARAPKPRRTVPAAKPLEAQAPDEPSSLPPAPLEEIEPAAVEPAPARKRAPRPKDRSAKLGTLDVRAQQRLAAGDLGAADRLLADLIRRGGQHRLVEAAYGDRFTIAHRTGRIGQQRQLWRAYLKRFPQGRFADDARAGLCRRAPGTEARACWSAYVRDFPAGAYRGRADRVLEDDEP